MKALTEPKVVCPTLEEQIKIVCDLENRLSVCDSIERTVDLSLQQAESMRQSVLKQAFEGSI
jgi:type I restriction enzyme S subunit